jgi:two-component system, OmpR family, sensor histidine kinase KdpD
LTSSNANRLSGWVFSVCGVLLATIAFSLCSHFLDKGQASLLYLPLVIASAIRFGFGPAVLGAILSFLCWDFFFLPPVHTLVIRNFTDWISLIVFLTAAVMTAQLASRARTEAEQARARRDEIAMLFDASESISQTVQAEMLLPELADRLLERCQSKRCVILSRTNSGKLLVLTDRGPGADRTDHELIVSIALVACEYGQVIGFGNDNIWRKALAEAGLTASGGAMPQSTGVYVPLHAQDSLVGVLHLAPRTDNRRYNTTEERLIRTLANHAAVVIARQALAKEAAETAALKEADILKDTLLSLVSHELRSPLAAIKATASGMLQPDAIWPESATREALNAIDKEADRMTGVVTNLLDLSRLEAGAWKPDKDWCDISDIVGSVLDRLPEEDAKRIRVSLADDSPLVKADYIQIALTLKNLLENAIKYTAPDTPVDLTISPDAGSGIKISVRDYGQGIQSKEEEAIFQRFYRGAEHKTGTVHGTGIGLALCQAIVTAHGGRIWASNAGPRESPGAVFTIVLPSGL